MIRMCSRRWYRLCIGIAAACVAVVPAWAQFEARSTRTIPSESVAMAAGDFNNDGKLDLAVQDGKGLSIALGNGDGTFQAPTTYPYLIGVSLAVGDFNGDGNLDVVAPYGNAVGVFIGNGDGTFRSPITSPTTESTTFVIVGDFNGDHKLDIAIIDPPYISVLLGNGDGTFAAPSDSASFVGPQNLAVGDFNNDRNLDVAAVGYSGGGQSVGILLGNGDGTLQSPRTYPLSDTPDNVAVGDFNRDGNLDVVVGDAVIVFLGNGDGSLQPGAEYFGARGDVMVADFNGDGDLDIATQGYPSGLEVFYGKGDGTFEPPELFSTGPNGLSPITVDLNGDHKADVAFLSHDVGAKIVLNTGTAGFSPASPLAFATQLVGMASPSQVVTLTNTGQKALSITSIKGSGQFEVSTTCGSSLAAGKGCKISAVFKPTTQGDHAGLITLIDSASSKPEVIELTGAGTVVALAPDGLTFATQKVGTASPPQQVRLTNTGKVPLNITEWTLYGFDPGDFSQSNNCPSPLEAGGACTIMATFKPTHTGARSAVLYVTDSGGGTRQAVTLAGTGD